MSSNPAALQHLFPALEILDQFVAEWQQAFADNLSCQRGCSVCCTDRVTVTEAEAARILIRISPDAPPLGDLHGHVPSPSTTNEFAFACLRGIGREPEEIPEPTGACPFLSEAKECTVYSVRPLMCRLFFSTVPCLIIGEATVQELHFLTQIILQQLAEHISKGTRWGPLATMLKYRIQAGINAGEDLRICREIPGFPLTLEDKKKLAPRLAPLLDRLKAGGWLPNDFSLNFDGLAKSP